MIKYLCWFYICHGENQKLNIQYYYTLILISNPHHVHICQYKRSDNLFRYFLRNGTER